MFVLGVLLTMVMVILLSGPKALAQSLSFVVGLVCRGYGVKKFRINEIHLGMEPEVVGFELVVISNVPYSPDIVLKWDRFRLVVQWRRLFIPFYATLLSYSSRYLRHYHKWCCKWRWDPLGITAIFNDQVNNAESGTSQILGKSYKIYTKVRIREEMEMTTRTVRVFFEHFHITGKNMAYKDLLGDGGGARPSSGDGDVRPSNRDGLDYWLLNDEEKDKLRARRAARKEVKRSWFAGRIGLIGIFKKDWRSLRVYSY